MNRIQALRYNLYALLAILALLVVFVFGVLWTLIPAPPKSIAIATGFQDGLYYRFGELKLIERSATDPTSREKDRQTLAEIQSHVNAMKVSALDSKEFYDLKGHVNMVRERLELDP